MEARRLADGCEKRRTGRLVAMIEAEKQTGEWWTSDWRWRLLVDRFPRGGGSLAFWVK